MALGSFRLRAKPVTLGPELRDDGTPKAKKGKRNKAK